MGNHLSLHPPLGSKNFFSSGATGKEIKCSKSKIHRLLETFKATRDVMDKLARGRNYKTDEEDDEKIFAAAESESSLSYTCICLILWRLKLWMCHQWLFSDICAKLFSFMGHICQRHCWPKTIENVTVFTRRNAKRDWSKVLFSAEKTFHLFTVLRKIWRRVKVMSSELLRTQDSSTGKVISVQKRIWMLNAYYKTCPISKKKLFFSILTFVSM